MSEKQECLNARALLPELATGAIAGDERAFALGHVAVCPDCRQELSELTTIADALLQLAPWIDPPPAFEGRVLAGLSAQTLAPRGARVPATPRASVATWRRRLTSALAFAVAVVLSLGAGMTVTYWQTAADRKLADQYRTTLAIAGGRYLKAVRITTADAQPAGTAFLYQGNPSWVLVTISAAPTDGTFDIFVIDRHGAAHRVGVCQITDRTVTAGYRIHVAVAEIAQIQLHSTNPAGTVLYATT